MSLGSRIKERREALGLTQGELGKELGVTGSAIGNYENGVSFPKADVLYGVFEALQCDANYLFQDEIRNMNEQETLERQLLDSFQQLNEEGREKVVQYAADLVCTGKYIKTITPKMVENA